MLDADVSQVDVFAARIRQALAARNAQGLRRYRLSASVGASRYDADRGQTIEGLLAHADTVMYEQKRARRAGLIVSVPPPGEATAKSDSGIEAPTR